MEELRQKECYLRSLLLLFLTVYHKLKPEADIIVEHTLYDGLYCTVSKDHLINSECILKEMYVMKNKNLVYQEKTISIQEAITYFTKHRMHEKVTLLKQSNKKNVTIQLLDDYIDILYGDLLSNTSMLPNFFCISYEQGYWLSFKETPRIQPKLFTAFQLSEALGRILNVSTIAQLNTVIQEKKFYELVLLCEMAQEKRYAKICETIMKQRSVQCLLIAGPSCSGKSSSVHRLQMHFKMYGKETLCLSMDDFYKNREDTEKLADGSYDFDSIETIDLTLFHSIVTKLLNKESVQLPKYNFKTGKREWETTYTKLEDTQILMIEGIHALHPITSKFLEKEHIYKLYINALTHMNIDEHTRIKTSDYRLLRRIARDSITRNWSAKETLSLWKNVRDKEDTHIYPYQEEADDVMNTAMAYELSILKSIVQPQLECIDKGDVMYLKAQELLNMLSLVYESDADIIPRYSLFAEFIGKSMFSVS